MSKNCEKNTCVKKCSIGGQALIEGIMMRGPKTTAMAIRDPNGEIILEKCETKMPPKIGRIPIIRGVVNFVFSMAVGYKSLMRSAEIAGLEDAVNDIEGDKKDKKNKNKDTNKKEETVTSDVSAESADAEAVSEELGADVANVKEDTAKKGKNEKEEKSSPLMTVLMIISTILGIALSILLFVALPSFIYNWSIYLIPVLRSDNIALNSLLKSVFEGVLKIAILVVYMLLVTLMKDIRRTFQYHGAEHKTIFCYEHDKELTVENVRNERRFHPRCGTSFLILMLIVSIFVSFFIDPLFIWLRGSIAPTAVRVLIRLLLIPLVMGIGYELIKFAGKHDNLFTKIISAPGVWLQHITVLEPTDDMIECAIAAFVEVLPNDGDDKKCEKDEEKKDET